MAGREEKYEEKFWSRDLGMIEKKEDFGGQPPNYTAA